MFKEFKLCWVFVVEGHAIRHTPSPAVFYIPLYLFHFYLLYFIHPLYLYVWILQTYEEYSAETRELTVNMYTAKETGMGFVIRKLEIVVAGTTLFIDQSGMYANGALYQELYVDDVIYAKRVTGSFYMARLFGMVIVYNSMGTSLHINASPYYSDKVTHVLKQLLGFLHCYVQCSISWIIVKKFQCKTI